MADDQAAPQQRQQQQQQQRGKGKGKRQNKKKWNPLDAKKKKRREERAREAREVAELEKRIAREAPPAGTNPLSADFDLKRKRRRRKGDLPEVASEADKKAEAAAAAAAANAADGKVMVTAARRFVEMPISRRTLEGLTEARYTHMTDIQRASLPHALAGRDVLGAARTGSGKTLSFVVPVLEALYRRGWGPMDGLGALIVSPTRELAVQIFDVLNEVGKHHRLSAGLVIGGKDFEDEQALVETINVLVATPGRLLQHFDQTAGFDGSRLQVLVLDEADRILDMGFAATLNSILSNLPSERQTLLFSATQTKSVKDLVRLSLTCPEYISVQRDDSAITPRNLTQHYAVIEAGDKINVLFSFVKTHLKNKSMVFLSSCKQARFVWEVFRRLHPGVAVMVMHGQQSQARRMAVYYDYCSRNHAVLFATDLAARGLDFPDVDWVVQFDCPDSVDSYVHRVGRTARYRSGGHGLLLLLPSERAMAGMLKKRRVPVKRVKMNPHRLQDISNRFASFCSEDPDIKYLGQKAFVSYVRSVHLASNKEVFDVTKLPAAALAESMGLPGTPRIKLLSGSRRADKNQPHALRKLMQRKDKAKGGEAEAAKKTDVERLISRKNDTVYGEARGRLRADRGEADDDDVLVVKRRIEAGGDDEDEGGVPFTKEEMASMSRKQRSEARRMLREMRKERGDGNGSADSSSLSSGSDSDSDSEEEDGGGAGRKRKRRAEKDEDEDEDGSTGGEDEDEGGDDEARRKAYYERVSKRLRAADADDQAAEKQRQRAKKREQKEKLRARDAEKHVNNVPVVAMLGGAGSSDEESGSESGSGSGSESGSDSDSSDEEPAPKRGRRSVDDEEALALEILKRRSA